MIVHMKYLAPLRFTLGKKTGVIEIPDRDTATVWELLEYVAKNEPRFLKVAALDRESILNKITVLVENKLCGLDSTVPDGANVILMSPISGG